MTEVGEKPTEYDFLESCERHISRKRESFCQRPWIGKVKTENKSFCSIMGGFGVFFKKNKSSFVGRRRAELD